MMMWRRSHLLQSLRKMAPRAHQRIDSALIVGTVAQAIDALEVTRVVGTSARPRRLETPCWDPHMLARAVLHETGSTAIVFGPEDYGLDNLSVARCDAVLRIPTTSHSSLNLAQAVNVTASTLRLFATPTDPAPQAPPASPEDRRQTSPPMRLLRPHRNLEETLYSLNQSVGQSVGLVAFRSALHRTVLL